jgi:putative restriction endonuclease
MSAVLTNKAWALITLGDDRQYAGNTGYDDELQTVYRYDSFVPNSKQVRAGDIVILRGADDILGSARIERIQAVQGEKTQRRCPECGTTSIRHRKNRLPAYRCDSGPHEFSEPSQTTAKCTLYAAWIGDTFVPTQDRISVRELAPAYVERGGQLAIRRLQLGALPQGVLQTLGLLVAGNDRAVPESDGSSYEPLDIDTRASLLREIRARQGQATFRRALFQRYGSSCMISGCTALEVIEAAHIQGYRGMEYNHPENGLVLRSDLHTLFDLGLLSINPATMTISVAPIVGDPAYLKYDGQPLIGSANRQPSLKALAIHWAEFERRRVGRQPTLPSA